MNKNVKFKDKKSKKMNLLWSQALVNLSDYLQYDKWIFSEEFLGHFKKDRLDFQ